MTVKGTSLYPVDTWYSWLVAILGSLVYSMALGQVRVGGIAIIELRDKYQLPDSEGFWMVGLTTTLMLGAGPVSGSLISVINHRNVLLLGSLIVSSSLMVIAYSPDHRALYLAYALMGVGTNFSFITALVATSHYFVKHRALAMGITAAGAGIGTFYYPPLVRYLLDTLTFTEAMVVLAAIYLHVAIAAMLMRPESSWSHARESDSSTIDGSSTNREKTDKDKSRNDVEVTQQPAVDDAEQSEATRFLADNASHAHTSPGTNSVKPTNPLTSSPSESPPTSPRTSLYGSKANELADAMLASELKLSTVTDVEAKGEADLTRLTLVESLKLLFTNKVYLIYMVASMIVNMGYNITFTALPFYAEEVKVDKTHVAYSFALCGVLGIFSRVAHSYLAGRKYVTAVLQVGLTAIFAAVSLLFVISGSHIHNFYLTGAGLGLFAAAIIPMVPVVLLERFEPHTVSVGIGFIYGVQGLGAFISFAVAPRIEAGTGTWLTSLWCIFAVIFLSGLINVITGILNPLPEQKYCKCARPEP